MQLIRVTIIVLVMAVSLYAQNPIDPSPLPPSALAQKKEPALPTPSALPPPLPEELQQDVGQLFLMLRAVARRADQLEKDKQRLEQEVRELKQKVEAAESCKKE